MKKRRRILFIYIIIVVIRRNMTNFVSDISEKVKMIFSEEKKGSENDNDESIE